MGDNKKDQLQGTLDLLVLRILSSAETMHGFAIAERIEQVSKDVLRVEAGSLYPALHRMEQEGWLTATWEQTEKGREAKFYSLTRRGRTQLNREKESWDRLTRGVSLVLAS